MKHLLDPNDIKTVSLENILKFFSDHSELDGTEVTKRIADDCKDFKNCCITGRGGLIRGRENIEKILGDFAPSFFAEISTSRAHLDIAVKNFMTYEGSLK